LTRLPKRVHLRPSKGSIQALDDGGHLLGVGLFFFEFLVLFIVDDVFFHSVLEFVLVFTTLDVAIGHDTHNLLVVVQDRKTRQL
jgi:hypothetical protein